MVYSISASSMFSIDEDGKHSLEVTYKDSDGVNVGAYSEGDTFDEVLGDVLDQIEEGVADADDARADREEAAQLQAQIDDLTKQLDDLKARSAELQQKNIKIEASDRYANLEAAYHKAAKNLNDKLVKDFNDSDIFKSWLRFK